ncbi:hypothetical protein BGX33_006504 [Mortierella sp. NVP41]|nr:hypothetical protein BGX33_006504 [Mortierella sp. NVP41]
MLKEALIHNHNQQIGVPSRRLLQQQQAAAAEEELARNSSNSSNNEDDNNNSAAGAAAAGTGTNYQRQKQGSRSMITPKSRHRHLLPGVPPLSELVFESPTVVWHQLHPFLISFYSITSLTIRSESLTCAELMNMTVLFTMCPYLEDLRIEFHGSISLKGSWFRPHGAPTDTPISEYNSRTLGLSSLVLLNVRMHQFNLRDLLEISPRLKDLRIVLEFVKYIQATMADRAVPLKTFYVSVKWCVVQDEVFGVCPRSSDITIQVQDLTPSFVRMLTDRPNHVTCLENFARAPTPSVNLHQYLCSSPHLLHLKASKVGIIVDDMNIFIIPDKKDTDTAKDRDEEEGNIRPHFPKLWACRNLRTLQVAFVTRHRIELQGAWLLRPVFG